MQREFKDGKGLFKNLTVENINSCENLQILVAALNLKLNETKMLAQVKASEVKWTKNRDERKAANPLDPEIQKIEESLSKGRVRIASLESAAVFLKSLEENPDLPVSDEMSKNLKVFQNEFLPTQRPYMMFTKMFDLIEKRNKKEKNAAAAADDSDASLGAGAGVSPRRDR